MNKFDVFTQIDDKRWRDVANITDELISEVKEAAISVVQNDVSFLKKSKNFSVNLMLSDNQAVQALNKEFRGLNQPTNVLSFASIDDTDFEAVLAFEDDIELGDVIVAFEVMQDQAQTLGITLKDHFCHLWAHGLLHILGYDHIEESDRLNMEAKEVEILKRLGIDNPYEE